MQEKYLAFKNILIVLLVSACAQHLLSMASTAVEGASVGGWDRGSGSDYETLGTEMSNQKQTRLDPVFHFHACI